MTRADPDPSLWTRLRAAVDPHTRRYLGAYAAYALAEAEYVTYIGNDLGAVRRWLRDGGYDPARLSAAKRHPETGDLHVLSMRRRPEDHPPAVEGTALARTDPRTCQYHLHAFPAHYEAGDGFLDVFLHYERAPDLRRLAGESWREALARCREHYRPRYGETYLRGIADLDL